MLNINTYKVLDVNVSAVDLDRAANAIVDMVERKDKGYVCVAPVATIVDARRSAEYRKVVNSAAMVTPDGMPVVWLGRLQGSKDVARTYGPDLMLELCKIGQGQGLRHFFYGGTDAVCDRLTQCLKGKFPDLQVAGAYAPPYVPKAEQVSQDIVDLLNAAKADVLWVGLGAPKQDHWMAIHRPLLDVPVMIGIGAAFDFHAGVKPQAPRWMMGCGLEWLFRLCSEPRRLWKRYLIGNSQFVWWLLMDALFRKKDKQADS